MADDEKTTQETAAGARENENEHADEPAAPADPVPTDDIAAAALSAIDGLAFAESHGQPVIYSRPEQWAALAEFLRAQQFETCVDVCGVDQLLNAARPLPVDVAPERFEVVANFLSRARGRRIRAICEVPAANPQVPSITSLYPGVDWSERETYDLFGIEFVGHPDLTRILLPEDWEGFPLRKDSAAARVPVQFKGTRTTPDQQSLKRDGR